MQGPEILARSLSQPKVADQFDNVWQYHPRSDRHSKIACWAILFDLMRSCPLFVEHAVTGKIGFGINHEMRDFRTGRKKNLDLVVCTPGGTQQKRIKGTRSTFRELAEKYNIDLNADETRMLKSCADLPCVPVGAVHLALEAKATMTAHGKALPRLHDELDSSHSAVHGSSDFAIACGFVMINLASTFISPDKNRHCLRDRAANVSKHTQPRDTIRTIEKIREIRRRTTQNSEGFDAIGIVCLEIVNDGTPVEIVAEPPAPTPADIFHYDAMIRRIAALYEGKFASI